MITTVTQKNMITIPAEVARRFGIKPGFRLDWQPVEGKDEILVRVIPDRGELARRLLGANETEVEDVLSAYQLLFAEIAAVDVAVAQTRTAVLVHRDEHMRSIPPELVRQQDLIMPAAGRISGDDANS